MEIFENLKKITMLKRTKGTVASIVWDTGTENNIVVV